MTAEAAINLRDVLHVPAGKERIRFRRAQHVHAHQVLSREEIDLFREAFGECWIVERGQKNEQGAAAQAETEKGEEIVEVGRDARGLKAVEGVATEIVMGLAVLCANEALHLVGKNRQAKEIAALPGGEAKDEGAIDVALQDREAAGLARAQAGSIEHHVNLLGALDLENFRDRPAALGRRFPMHVVHAVAGDVIAELLEVSPLPHLPDRPRAGVAAMKENGGEILPLGKKIGISAKLGADAQCFPDVPEAKDGRRFQGHALDGETAALRRRDGHCQGDSGIGRQGHAHLAFLNLDFRREIERQAKRQSFRASVL